MNNFDGNSSKQDAEKPKRQSAAVYRRRRLVAVFLLLIVFVLCVIIVFALIGIFSNNKESHAVSSGDGRNAPPTSTVHDAEEQQGAMRQDPADVCDKGKVVVTADSDSVTYAEGQYPRFGVSIENKNSVECDINLGTNSMNYSIRQGSHEVFSSQHCAVGELTDWPRRLAPGATVTVEDFTWQRTFTQQGCPESSAKVNQALPGNYSLTVQIGSYRSKQLEFALK